MANTQNSNYRWYMLGLGTLAYFFIAGMSRMCMPVLFKEISADLGLSMVGAFLAPPLGNSLTAFGPGLPFILWAALSAMGLPMFLFLKDE